MSQSEDLKNQLPELEIQKRNLEILLDRSIQNNEILAKTKEIYHELKIVSDRIKELTKLI